ncbi:protein of unknown function [Lacrimispora sphenoides]|jgi:hypothetical protein|uniref:PAAR-like protein n=1 Tax=Lacrimispora sphenoides TaxID=29370 RepID=UPI0008B2E0B2|nr:PAAR-like protein [Lacrimispora sphenoides]SET46534.1 protein of unknown function [Lacrimispora sphenoides]
MANESVKAGVKITHDAAFIGDFKFNFQGNLIGKYIEMKDAGNLEKYEKEVMELMVKHYAFYEQLQKEKEYITRGSILRCSGGNKMITFDILNDHGVEKAGSPLGICTDCKANENIHTFGECKIPTPEGYPERPIVIPTLKSKFPFIMHKCIPMLDGSWSRTKSSKVKVWDESVGRYVDAITTGDFLVCLYGGIIEVVEVPTVNGTRRAGKVTTLNSTGYNMIANMERNLSLIGYDKKTGLIISIPTTSTDVGYGHDYIKNPLPTVPTSMTASKAYELLKKDLSGIGPDGKVDKIKDYIGAIADIDACFTQDHFNALVGLRYNIGSLGVVDGLLPYLENGAYKRSELKKIVNSYYDAIIKKNPANELYRDGWYNRTEKMLDIFFDGNYGYMPIDAVNGKVVL